MKKLYDSNLGEFSWTPYILFLSLNQRNTFVMIKFQEWPLKVTFFPFERCHKWLLNLPVYTHWLISSVWSPKTEIKSCPWDHPFSPNPIITMDRKNKLNQMPETYVTINMHKERDGYYILLRATYLGPSTIYTLFQFQREKYTDSF